jgi:hypothetical protein
MNPDACSGLENENDGCGMVFFHRTPGGSHCPMCKKLKAPGLSAEAKAELTVLVFLCCPFLYAAKEE